MQHLYAYVSMNVQFFFDEKTHVSLMSAWVNKNYANYDTYFLLTGATRQAFWPAGS